PQVAPQGWFGRPQLGSDYNGFGGGHFLPLLPFEAGAQLDPQGFFGNLLGQVGPQLGGLIGGRFGNAGLGQQIGGIAGQLGRFLPFEAGPQLDPQGFFGNLLGQVGPQLGGLIGGRFG